jgi:DNA-binding response OmpR family regulator
MNSASPRPLRLLVVDDIAENRSLLGRYFGKNGFEIAQADGGHAALDLIGRQSFDVVLLDIMMPGIDGLEVLKRIRQAHTQTALPVIMVSGRGASDDVALARDLGANDFITKPINLAAALVRVRNNLASAQRETTADSDPAGEVLGEITDNEKAARIPAEAARLLDLARKFRREGNSAYAERLTAKATQYLEQA